MTGVSGALRRLFAPVDIASLAAFRVVFGGCMLYETLSNALGGHFHEYLIAPAFHFKFYGFAWIDELPGPWMHLVFWLMGISALLVLVGALYRVASVVLFATFGYCFLLEASAYRNHYYLLALLAFLMIFLPAHRAHSVDAHFRPAIRSMVGPAWAPWLLRFQLLVVYFFAGVAKIDRDWIAGWSLRAIFENGGHSPQVLEFLLRPWVTGFFVWSGMLFDLLVGFALLWRRTQVFAFLAAMGFHLTNALFLVDVGVFPWFMLFGSTIFFAPEWPRALLRRLGFASRLPPERLQSAPPAALGLRQRIIVVALVVHVAIQLFLPLRQHLYPGSTAWTHEGHRWAWRMKLVPKQATKIRFFTVDPEDGSTIDLTPNVRNALAGWQSERMARQPDLLLQFAHDLSARLRERTGKDFPIYADIQVAMSGRPPRPIVDPTRDLAKVEWSLAPADWILPLPPY